jgi:hypothetical protein
MIVIGVLRFPLFTPLQGAYINGRLMLRRSISRGGAGVLTDARRFYGPK